MSLDHPLFAWLKPQSQVWQLSTFSDEVTLNSLPRQLGILLPQRRFYQWKLQCSKSWSDPTPRIPSVYKSRVDSLLVLVPCWVEAACYYVNGKKHGLAAYATYFTERGCMHGLRAARTCFTSDRYLHSNSWRHEIDLLLRLGNTKFLVGDEICDGLSLRFWITLAQRVERLSLLLFPGRKLHRKIKPGQTQTMKKCRVSLGGD